MKKWLKWTLGIIGVIIVVIVGFFAWNWYTFRIVSGTENLSSNVSPIPAVEINTLPDLNKGDTDWPSWYGPDNDQKSKVTGIKTDWSQGLSKAWEVNYLCQGNGTAAWSAPVIQGDRLVICGRDTDQDYVFCLNAQNGKLIWYKSYRTDAKKNHGSGPRATPFIDDDRVYTFGRNGDLVCWNLFDGQKIWHKNVSDEGGKEPVWGHSSSPVVIDSLVLIQGGGDIRTIAYHKISGDIIWESGKGLPGYAAIAPMSLANQNIILAFHGTGLAALNTYTGENLWNIDWPTSYDVNATTPLVMDDFIFISSGYGTGSMLLRANGTKVDSVWRTKDFSSIHSDPYVIDSYLYGYSGDSFQNKGAFKCLDLSNGKEVWSTNDMGWGTCTWVDGYLLCCDIKGNIFLMQPSPDEFKLITQLEDALGDIRGPVWTIPVVANDHLYLRFKQNLVCYNIVN
jgi:outer membrane protein assembly factor BamB